MLPDISGKSYELHNYFISVCVIYCIGKDTYLLLTRKYTEASLPLFCNRQVHFENYCTKYSKYLLHSLRFTPVSYKTKYFQSFL